MGSFTLDSSLPMVTANEFSFDVTTAAPTLPACWQFKHAGTCRLNSLTFNAVANANDVACMDWTQGQAVGGIGAYAIGFLGPNTAQIRGVMAVTQSLGSDLPAGQEYFSFNVSINNQKTRGTGSCSGCDIPACLALSSVKVYTDGGNSFVILTTPAVGSNSNYVSWQGGGGVVPFANGYCAGFDTAGFAINATVVGRGSVVRSRTKAQYPPGSPVTLTAQPQASTSSACARRPASRSDDSPCCLRIPPRPRSRPSGDQVQD